MHPLTACGYSGNVGGHEHLQSQGSFAVWWAFENNFSRWLVNAAQHASSASFVASLASFVATRRPAWQSVQPLCSHALLYNARGHFACTSPCAAFQAQEASLAIFKAEEATSCSRSPPQASLAARSPRSCRGFDASSQRVRLTSLWPSAPRLNRFATCTRVCHSSG